MIRYFEVEQKAIKGLLEAEPQFLNPKLKETIRTWEMPPTALQLLELSYTAKQNGWISGYARQLIRVLYDSACRREKTTHEIVLSKASWKNTDS